jgi:aconitate hydratase
VIVGSALPREDAEHYDASRFRALGPDLTGPILLKVENDTSTDEVIQAGATLRFYTNFPVGSEFAFAQVDDTYAKRALKSRDRGQRHVIVAGANYGQGSSREQAALFPRYLGLEVVIAKSIARIHWQNLVNFGVLPLTFADPSDYDRLKRGDTIQIVGIADAGSFSLPDEALASTPPIDRTTRQ